MGSIPWFIWKTFLHWWLGSLKVERYHSFQPTTNGFWHCSSTVPLVQHQNLTASRPFLYNKNLIPKQKHPRNIRKTVWTIQICPQHKDQVSFHFLPAQNSSQKKGFSLFVNAPAFCRTSGTRLVIEGPVFLLFDLRNRGLNNGCIPLPADVVSGKQPWTFSNRHKTLPPTPKV